MANVDVGGITYTVDANTGGLISSAKEVADSTSKMESSFKRADAAVDKLNTTYTKTAASVNKANKSFAASGSTMQNLGYQIQDAAVQLQGGTSAMVVFAQQGSQIASSFGSGGAVIGAIIAVSAALSSALIPSLSGSSEATEELIEKLKDLSAQEGITAAQTAVVVKASEEERKANEERIDQIDKELQLANKRVSQTERAGAAYSKTAEQIAKATQKDRDSIAALTAERELLAEANKKAIEREEELTDSVDESTEKERERVEALQILNEAVQEQIDTVGLSRRELALYAAEQLGATQSDKDRINTLYDLIDAEKARVEAEREAERERRRNENLQARAPTLRAGVLSDAGGESGLQAQTDLRIQEIEKLADLEIVTEQEKNAAILALRQDLATQIADIENAEHQRRLEQTNTFAAGAETAFNRVNEAAKLPAQTLGTDFVSAAVSAGDAMANGFANAIVQGDSLSDVISNVAQQFLTQILASLIKVGAQYAINAALGASSAAAATAAGVAQAAALGSAWAAPAALASLASFGANAAPAAAGITSTVALSQGLAVAGGLQYGGTAKAGQMYRVTEDGSPELFSDGSRQYLIPGRTGEVTSNRDMTAAGGSAPVTVNLNIQESPNSTFSVTSTSQTDQEVTINAIIADIDGGGPVSQAITRNTSANRRTQ